MPTGSCARAPVLECEVKELLKQCMLTGVCTAEKAARTLQHRHCSICNMLDVPARWTCTSMWWAACC